MSLPINEYVDLSAAVYKIVETSEGAIPDVAGIIDNTPANYTYDTVNSTHQYGVFRRKNSDDVVIAVRGTKRFFGDALGKDGGGWFEAGTGNMLETPRVLEIKRLYKKLLNNPEVGRVTLTGHSLGGTIAGAIANEMDSEAYVFNPAKSPLGDGYRKDNGHTNVFTFTSVADLTSFFGNMKNWTTRQSTEQIIPVATKSSFDFAIKNHKIDVFKNVNWNDTNGPGKISIQSIVDNHTKGRDVYDLSASRLLKEKLRRASVTLNQLNSSFAAVQKLVKGMQDGNVADVLGVIGSAGYFPTIHLVVTKAHSMHQAYVAFKAFVDSNHGFIPSIVQRNLETLVDQSEATIQKVGQFVSSKSSKLWSTMKSYMRSARNVNSAEQITEGRLMSETEFREMMDNLEKDMMSGESYTDAFEDSWFDQLEDKDLPKFGEEGEENLDTIFDEGPTPNVETKTDWMDEIKAGNESEDVNVMSIINESVDTTRLDNLGELLDEEGIDAVIANMRPEDLETVMLIDRTASNAMSNMRNPKMVSAFLDKFRNFFTLAKQAPFRMAVNSLGGLLSVGFTGLSIYDTVNEWNQSPAFKRFVDSLPENDKSHLHVLKDFDTLKFTREEKKWADTLDTGASVVNTTRFLVAMAENPVTAGMGSLMMESLIFSLPFMLVAGLFEYFAEAEQDQVSYDGMQFKRQIATEILGRTDVPKLPPLTTVADGIWIDGYYTPPVSVNVLPKNVHYGSSIVESNEQMSLISR